MDAAFIAALVGGIGTVLGVVTAFIINLRKAPAETALIEAQADKAKREADIADAQADRAQAEANRLLLDNLKCEIERLKTKIVELEQRLTTSESRATAAEVRLAESESRGNEFRRAVIAVGERLDRERREFRETTEKLCIIIEHLLSCVGDPSKAGEVDSDAIRRLIENIRSKTASDMG